CQQYNSLPLTS
nr:immunoglobulin light chain junction region [Macaca mulatta]